MEQRLSILTLGVESLTRSKAFYDALGWEAANDGAAEAENIVAYNLHGMALALYPREKFAEEIGEPVQAPTGYSPVTLAYNVESEAEVDAVLQEAVAAGGTLVKAARKVFWGGYSGYFADPDKHLWEVAYNPFSPLRQGGVFQWNCAEA